MYYLITYLNLVWFQICIIHQFGFPSSKKKKKKNLRVKKGKKIKFNLVNLVAYYTLKFNKLLAKKVGLGLKHSTATKFSEKLLTCFILWNFCLYILCIFCYVKILFLSPIFLSFPVYIWASMYIILLWIPGMEKTLQIYLLPKCKTWI